MSFDVITVSREFGSGGRTIAKETANRLGYAYYDNEIVTEIAVRSGFSEKFVREFGEYAGHTGSLLYCLSIGAGSTGTGMSPADSLYVFQQNFIREAAQKGKCVIVGRCADHILRDRDDVLNVFIHADKKFRADRIVRLYGESADAPEKRLSEKDKKRRTYYRYYTEREWGAAQNYHISFDSGVIGIERCAEILTKIVTEGAKHTNE